MLLLLLSLFIDSLLKEYIREMASALLNVLLEFNKKLEELINFCCHKKRVTVLIFLWWILLILYERNHVLINLIFKQPTMCVFVFTNYNEQYFKSNEEKSATFK